MTTSEAAGRGGKLTPGTIARIDSGQRFFEWLMPRLAGSSDDKETTLVMVMANLSDRYAEGVHDAADVARSVAARRPGDRTAEALAQALAELEKRHRAHAITSLDDLPSPAALSDAEGEMP